MGKKNIVAIIYIVVAVAIVGVLHQFVFAPLKQQWTQNNVDLNRLKGQYTKIVKDVGGGVSSDLSSELDRVIKVINDKVELDRQYFEQLNKKMSVIERFDPSVDYKQEILNQITRMQTLEKETTITKLNVTTPWGVNAGIIDGRFNKGFYAEDGRSKVYASTDSNDVILPQQGTIEFYVKPDWEPDDTEVHHKCFVMAIQKEQLSKDQLELRVNKYNETADVPIQLGMLIGGGTGPYPVECMASVYKGTGANLVFELKNFIQNPSTLTANISDWKKGQWYHVAAIWDSKRQALYINGQNRGIPFITGQANSIRSARNMDEEGLLLGGSAGGGMMMGGYGMGMGGMGMGGMGMGGMGMGGMGMGGMGMGAGSARFSPTAGQTLTANIALPEILNAVYVGADEEGNFGADATIDELRILNASTTSFSVNTEAQKSSNTLLVDNFENDLPADEDIPGLLMKLDQNLRGKSLAGMAPNIRERYENNYTLMKKSLGLDDLYMEDKDISMRIIRQLYIMDNIRRVTGKTYREQYGLFGISEESMKSEILFRIVSFMELCYDLARQATEDRIIAINNVVYKGQSYNVNDEELENYFETKLNDLNSKVFGAYGIMGGGMGGMGMGGMGMGGMGMGGMGMGGYGMGGGMGMGGGYGMGMGMGGFGGGGLTFNPETGEDWGSAEEKQAYIDGKQAEKEKLLLYRKYEDDGLIPPEVIVEFNADMEARGEDYYLKRSLTLDCDGDYRAMLQYFYNIEFGPRVNTINSVVMENKENDVVNAKFDVESHFLTSIEEEAEGETTAAAGL